ncbi:Na(+)-translocating NADH-quinone reductase subunit A [Shewanella youngdeokensis]|uniref:Na(+)-translocating NADH-quinone reductase subunit A n=1 Tax=Shewanella youngdeokensis TaxID=2999068 RepID=A0ABZ0JU90_9GAMM|nr:Na(+)-translocating NADH-quinone reductase subunit A [Shewanella sp. DAU334]
MTGYSNPVITVKKGLNVPIAGEPKQVIQPRKSCSQVALLGEEYVGLKPTMLVEVGDVVKKGQVVFEDKKNIGIKYTAPASGKVVAINRGTRRRLQSLVIECNQKPGINFGINDDIQSLDRRFVTEKLVASGLWTALRTRPFSRIPQLNTVPAGIFVSAIDTNPLAPDPQIVITQQADAFAAGLAVLGHLTGGKVHLCQAPGLHLPGSDLAHVSNHYFTGVHPAGLVGTHIHFIMPVSIERTVWHLGYQDVIAYGKLFLTGEIYTERVVSLAGPDVKQPRLITVQTGACLSEIVAGELKQGQSRVVSGSVLSGHTAISVHDFLGRFHNQISALQEDAQHQLLPWVKGGSNKFSITRAVTSTFKGAKALFNFSTHTGGSARAMMAFGQLDRVMPLDILPTLLVRDLIVKDTDEAQALGALELDEEDLALCTFVCPSKHDFGKELRVCLDIIEREG